MRAQISQRRKTQISELLLRLIGLVLFAAAIPKMIWPDTFAQAVAGYGCFPPSLQRDVVLFVPPLEFVVGLMLALTIRKSAHFMTVMLFIGFILSLSYARTLHLGLSCGCFGLLDAFIHNLPHGLSLHILINCIILVFLLWFYKRRQ